MPLKAPRYRCVVRMLDNSKRVIHHAPWPRVTSDQESTCRLSWGVSRWRGR